MRTIKVDDEVFGELQNLAEPLVDTPNSVLRRILSLRPASDPLVVVGSEAEEQRQQGQTQQPREQRKLRATKRKRAAKGTILSEDAYEIPLLEVLAEGGGRVPTREAIEALGRKLDGRLQPKDREELSSGKVRWHNRAQFVRLRLVEAGDLIDDSPRGIWEISDQGRERLELNDGGVRGD